MRSKNVLILTNDMIGDAIARVRILQEYVAFFGPDCTYFLASVTNRPIVELVSNHVLSVDRLRFKSDDQYRKQFMEQINKLDLEYFLHAINRDILYNEAIARLVKARHRIAYEGDEIMLRDYQNKLENDLYTEIIPSLDKGKLPVPDVKQVTYVLEHEVHIFNSVTRKSLTVRDVEPNLRTLLPAESPALKKYESLANCILLGMGSSRKGKMYPPEQFAQVVRHLTSKRLRVVFAGDGFWDKDFFIQCMKYIPDDDAKLVTCVIGQLSLIETLQLIRRSRLFVGVDSALWNGAVALNVPSVVLFSGAQWGRFYHPSPNITYLHAFRPCYVCNWKCSFRINEDESYPCVSDIRPNDIIQAIEEQLRIMNRELSKIE